MAHQISCESNQDEFQRAKENGINKLVELPAVVGVQLKGYTPSPRRWSRNPSAERLAAQLHCQSSCRQMVRPEETSANPQYGVQGSLMWSLFMCLPGKVVTSFRCLGPAGLQYVSFATRTPPAQFPFSFHQRQYRGLQLHPSNKNLQGSPPSGDLGASFPFI